MSSTNKTTNYDLSQYIGSDKPTYLTDYNGDMYKIDAQMKVNADNVATAITGATNAATLASTANSTATTANTNANTAISKANTNETNLNNFMLKFNLNDITTYTLTDTSYDTGSITLASGADLSIILAKNTDGSMYKLYGQVIGTPNTTGLLKIVLPNTGLAVDEPYTVYPAGTHDWVGQNPVRVTSFIVNNNSITLQAYVENASVASVNKFYWMPCLYFNANFGDQAQEQE